MNLDNWLEEIHKFAEDNVSIILVGMKSDADKDRKVSVEEGMAFAEKHGMRFLEASAKNEINVKEVFTTLVSTIK